MAKKINQKSFSHDGNYKGFWRARTSFNRWEEREETRKDTIYKARFTYTNIDGEYNLEARFTADYGDWLDYIENTENAKKQINQTNQSGEKKEEERKKIDNIKPDLNQGQMNKLLDRIKDIETNIKKTVPEKVKDMKEIMAEIEKKSQETVDQLEEKQDGLQDNINRLGQDYVNKVKNGQNGAAVLIAAQINKLESEMAELDKAKDEFKDGNWAKDYIKKLQEENSKSWYQKIDWKSSTTYGKLSLLVVSIIALAVLIIWVAKKLKYFFISNK